MKFIHAADIHLDSPMLNLDRYDGAPVEEFRGATRRAMDNLVDLAISEQVSFVLIAGDLYDGECKDVHTAREFRRQIRRLTTAGIAVFIVRGNHDAQSRVTKAFAQELPDAVHIFRAGKPSTFRLDDLEVAVHGVSFKTASETADLSLSYPKPVSGFFNIGLLHTNCGARAGHDNYAPSSVEGLEVRGYDYWALGHIHEHQILHEHRPWIVYPGNLQGRHVGETGAKGCVLVQVEDGEVVSVEHRAIDVVRWARYAVDVAECDDAGSVVAAVSRRLDAELAQTGDRTLAARVELVGESAAHAELARDRLYWQGRLRELSGDRFEGRVWLEKVSFRTRPPTKAPVGEGHDEALEEFLGELQSEELNTDFLKDLLPGLAADQASLPSDPRLRDGALDLEIEDAKASLLEEAKQLLVARLTHPGGGR